MNDRLRVMQLHMMGFGDAAPAPGAPAPRPTSAAQTIVALRTALAVERKARLAAEARLRAVLAEIARQRPAPTMRRPAPSPRSSGPSIPAARSIVETHALPAPAPEVVEITPEMIDEDPLGAMQTEIMNGDAETEGDEPDNY